MDFLTLQCFIAVSETQSFTKAAEHVGRTQSAVSQQIAKLETLLEKQLVIRGRNLSLTPDGEILYGYAQKICNLINEAIDRVKEPELEGRVRFGLPEDFASVFLSDVLTSFARLHPRILLNIECDLTLNLLSRFKNKELDLVLLKMSRPEDFPYGVDVWSESLEWVGDRSLLSSNKAQSTIPLVLAPQPCVYRRRAIQALEDKQQKWRIVLSSHSFAGTIAAVKAGMGLTVLPRNMIPDGLPILSKADAPAHLEDTHISLLKHSADNIAVNSFENFVIERLN